MDNLSHSFVGLAAGEIVHRSLSQEPDEERNRLRRRLFLMTGWLSSNFPDLDLVLTPLLPEPLGYLLHHRGHTHTLLYALPQALLVVWGLIWLIWPAARRFLKQSAPARIGFALAVCVGFILHLLMDYLNSYGIHPFHPFDSRWFYGDMVFIVEPLFWIAFGVPLIMTIRRNSLKALLLVTLFSVLIFFTVREFLPLASLMALLGLALILGRLQFKDGSRGISTFLLAAVIGIGFIGMQGYASFRATQTLMHHLKMKDSASRFLDASMTSYPANPLCWIFVSVESNEADGMYRLRRGALSLAPEIMPVAACPARFAEPAMQDAAHPAIIHYAEIEGRLDTLRELHVTNCHVNAWLRFARAPSLVDGKATDLRFSSSPRGNFTTMDIQHIENRECSPFVPRWDYPRSDLLETPKRQIDTPPD
jgi:inner membrane protein